MAPADMEASFQKDVTLLRMGKQSMFWIFSSLGDRVSENLVSGKNKQTEKS